MASIGPWRPNAPQGHLSMLAMLAALQNGKWAVGTDDACYMVSLRSKWRLHGPAAPCCRRHASGVRTGSVAQNWPLQLVVTYFDSIYDKRRT